MDLSPIFLVAGALLVAIGAAMIYAPLGIIIAGAAVIAFAWLFKPQVER